MMGNAQELVTLDPSRVEGSTIGGSWLSGPDDITIVETLFTGNWRPDDVAWCPDSL